MTTPTLREHVTPDILERRSVLGGNINRHVYAEVYNPHIRAAPSDTDSIDPRSDDIIIRAPVWVADSREQQLRVRTSGSVVTTIAILICEV